MQEKELPIVNVSRTYLDENYYEREGQTWDCPTLIEYCKRNQYKEFDLPLVGIALRGLPWDITDMTEFISHVARVNNACLQHPIILDDKGNIADGWHRVVYAIVNGKSTIKAIRMQEMPHVSGKITGSATNTE